MLSLLLIKILRFYQRFLSPFFTIYLGINCRFYPSCSEYACLAIKSQGSLKGIYLAIKRFLKCHPLSKGGVDFSGLPESYRKEKLNG